MLGPVQISASRFPVLPAKVSPVPAAPAESEAAGGLAHGPAPVSPPPMSGACKASHRGPAMDGTAHMATDRARHAGRAYAGGRTLDLMPAIGRWLDRSV